MDASELLSGASVVPVVVIDDAALAAELGRALIDGGLGFIEVTLRTPAALGAIERLAAEVPELVVGVGSVRNIRQLGDAETAGARFFVSPGSSDDLITAARERELAFVPGAVTATESMHLLDAGYRLQKFFPAELAGGVAMLRAIGAPLPEPRFFPTGGITPDNAKDYLALDNVACVGGTWVVPPALLADRDFDAIRAVAKDAAALTL